MLALRDFLNACRSKKGGAYNAVSLKGGSYYIPPTKRSVFYDLWKEALAEMTETNCVPLVFRPLSAESECPLLIDVDIKTKHEPCHNAEMHAKLAVRIARKLGDEQAFLIVQKPRPYRVFMPSLKQEIWKSGCHIYFPESRISLEKARSLREYAIHKLPKCYDFEMLNAPEDVIDEAIIERKNGLLLAGSFKGEDKGGRYNVSCHGCIQGDEVQCVFYEDDLEWTEDIPMAGIYDFSFEPERAKPVKKPKSKPKKKAVKPPKMGNTRYHIDLGLFLAAVGDWVPSNDEYKRLCMYLANCDIGPSEAGHQCNAAWNPGADKLGETEAFIRKYRGQSCVGPIVVEQILRRHGQGEYIVDDILRRTKYEFYNQYTEFTRGIHETNEVARFLKDVVVFSFNELKYVWKMYQTKRDKNGNTQREIHVKISSHAPFSGDDNVMLELFPSKKLVLKALKDIESEAAKTLMEQVPMLSERELYKRAGRLVTLEPVELMMGKLLRHLHQKHHLRRYERFEFRPFAGARDPMSDQNVLNTFPGFYLERYTPSRTVDVKQTKIYEYIRYVMAHDADDLCEYIINMVAHLVQFPDVRPERLFILKSFCQGNGKSTWAKFLAAVLGHNLVTFHSNLDRLITNFNIMNVLKLILFVDDISAATKSQTRKLYSLTTRHVTTCEKKGEKPFSVDEYSSIWVTSNDKCPLYVTNEDRRQLVLEISTLRRRDRKFFKALNEEFKDLDIMKAIYDWLKARDLSEFSIHGDPPSDAKAQTVSACMPTAHRFARDFFGEPDWPYRTFKGRVTLGDYNVSAWKAKRGKFVMQLMCRVDTKALFQVYKAYGQTNYPNSRVHSIDQFLEELDQVGVVVQPKRQKIGGRSTRVVDLRFQAVKEGFQTLYPCEEFEAWESEKDPEKFINRLEQGECGFKN